MTAACPDRAAAAGFTCAARTHAGLVRPNNEDDYLMLAEHGLFIVADGMGGHAAGEVASAMAVQITARELGQVQELPESLAGARLRDAIQAAGDAIYERGRAERDKRGMATTATVLILRSGRYLIGHVGDCRAYLFRQGRLVQLTRDHSYAQELVEAGLLTPDRARAHPMSRVLTRCVGAGGTVCPDLLAGRLEPEDVLLLASDGLTDMLEDDYLARILSADEDPPCLVDWMIAEANRRGGLDNLTAIVVRIDAE